MKPEISIQVDSLTLHGVAAFDAEIFSSSLNHELTGLMAIDNSPSRSIQVGSVSVQAPVGVDSIGIGRYVARAIYSHLKGDDS